MVCHSPLLSCYLSLLHLCRARWHVLKELQHLVRVFGFGVYSQPASCTCTQLSFGVADLAINLLGVLDLLLHTPFLFAVSSLHCFSDHGLRT